MYSSLLTRYARHQFRRAISSTMNCRFLAQSTAPLGAAEVKQKPFDFSTEDLISESIFISVKIETKTMEKKNVNNFEQLSLSLSERIECRLKFWPKEFMHGEEI